jgi:CheY-like chemotaxis protein/two-component sensor histidine kinase
MEVTGNTHLSEMAAKISYSGQRAADLVRQLLAFSRKQIIKPEVLDLNAVVAKLEGMLRRIIGEHIHMKTRLAAGPKPVKADPAQIEQVIVNLAVNARDAMPEGGTLTIEIDNVVLDAGYAAQHLEVQPGQYMLLTVSDTGIGMTDDVKAHLFEPFFTTKEVGKGTGLGLATVYGIVKQSGGHIWVYSEEGHGTTFKIYLPQIPAAALPQVQAPPQAEMPTGTETILLVEDDQAVRELVFMVLQTQGYTVLKAENGRQALQVAAGYSHLIHMVVTDVVMPGMTGPDLAQQLLKIRPNLKLLFMSGYTDEAISSYDFPVEGVTFLQKPFSPRLLAHKVRAVLDGEE